MLLTEQEAAIRSEASNRTLRDLAAAFGVSHETIRRVLRAQVAPEKPMSRSPRGS